MNLIKNIKNIQNDHYSKNSSHTLINNACENDIVKLIPNFKNAMVTKINCKTDWNILYESDLKILDFTIDKNNNYYFTGYFDKNIKIDNKFQAILSESGCTDVFIAKMSNNEIVKIKFIPGLKNDKAFCIKIDSIDDIYICGYFTDSITFDTIYLSADGNSKNMFVAKIHGKSWEWLWANSAGKEGFNSKSKFLEIYNNDLYLIGEFDKEIIFNTIPKTLIKTNGKNIFLIKMSPINGDIKLIKYTNSNLYINVNDMTLKNKEIYLTGHLNGSILIGNDQITVDKQSSYISCFNLNLSSLWTKYSSSENNSGKKIVVDNIGNIYVSGKYESSFDMESHHIEQHSSHIGAYIVKINNNQIDWIHNLQATDGIIVYDIELDIYNCLYVAGSFNGNIIIQNKIYTGINQTFIMKLSNNQYVMSSVFSDIKFDNLKLYNYNNLYLCGVYNEKYKLIRLYFDDRTERCLGIVRTPGLSKNGDIIDVEFPGIVSIGYKNLNPGYNYFIQDNGEIDTNYNEYYFGTALSVDKLLIK